MIFFLSVLAGLGNFAIHLYVYDNDTDVDLFYTF